MKTQKHYRRYYVWGTLLLLALCFGYYLNRQQEREKIEQSFQNVQLAFNQKNPEAFLNCMTPEYRSKHNGTDAIQFGRIIIIGFI